MKKVSKVTNYKMLLIVRQDLKMSKGKIASQCCHATLGLYKQLKPEDVEVWENTGQKKVVLKCKTYKDMAKIQDKAKEMKISNYVVCDAGRTEIAAGSYTVLALYDTEHRLNQICHHLKPL